MTFPGKAPKGAGQIDVEMRKIIAALASVGLSAQVDVPLELEERPELLTVLPRG